MHRRACLNLIGSVAAATFAGEPGSAPVLAASSGQTPRLGAESAEEEVRQAERDRFAAMLQRDVVTLDALLAAELSYTHGDGRLVDKAMFIAELEAGEFLYRSIEPTGLKVRVFGDAAIVTGSAGMQVVNKGSPAQIRIVYTNTHLRRQGRWQMVAWHATRVAQ